jgi:hypothetical protein
LNGLYDGLNELLYSNPYHRQRQACIVLLSARCMLGYWSCAKRSVLVGKNLTRHRRPAGKLAVDSVRFTRTKKNPQRHRNTQSGDQFVRWMDEEREQTSMIRHYCHLLLALLGAVSQSGQKSDDCVNTSSIFLHVLPSCSHRSSFPLLSPRTHRCNRRANMTEAAGARVAKFVGRCLQAVEGIRGCCCGCGGC